MLEGLKDLFTQSKRILLVTHQDPDGDALGSMVALALVFSRMGKEVYPVLSTQVPSCFLFLEGINLLQKGPERNSDLLIVLDHAESKRSEMGLEILELMSQRCSVLIDHHPKGDLWDIAHLNFANPLAASTTEILYFLFQSLEIPINHHVATALLTGLLTDTNIFCNSNTTALSLRIAAHLVSLGAKRGEIIRHVFGGKNSDVLRLWGRALSRLRYNKKYSLLVTFLKSEDFLECGVPEEAASGIVNFLNLNLFGPSLVLLLVERTGKIKGSLRTQKENLDLSQLAQILGGGGHKKAAGFEVEGQLKSEKGNVFVV